jgi:hypothetical protein
VVFKAFLGELVLIEIVDLELQFDAFFLPRNRLYLMNLPDAVAAI